MFKSIFLVISIFISINVSAGIITSSLGTISKLYAYDDHGSIQGKDGAAVYIYMNTGLSACPNSVYISPNAPGYNTLVSFALTAYTTKASIKFQVYDDITRKLDGRCEVDAIRFES